MRNPHTKFGWTSFNGKGEDSIMDCDDARNTEIFFRKVLLAYRSLQNLLEACIGGGQISLINQQISQELIFLNFQYPWK